MYILDSESALLMALNMSCLDLNLDLDLDLDLLVVTPEGRNLSRKSPGGIGPRK